MGDHSRSIKILEDYLASKVSPDRQVELELLELYLIDKNLLLVEKYIDVYKLQSGNSDKKGTQLSVNDFINKEIKIGEQEEFKGINFTVNNQKESSVNFFIKDNSVRCLSDFDISIMSMPPNGEPPVLHEKGKEFDLNTMSLLTINDNRYMFSDFSTYKILSIISIALLVFITIGVVYISFIDLKDKRRNNS